MYTATSVNGSRIATTTAIVEFPRTDGRLRILRVACASCVVDHGMIAARRFDPQTASGMPPIAGGTSSGFELHDLFDVRHTRAFSNYAFLISRTPLGVHVCSVVCTKVQ